MYVSEYLYLKYNTKTPNSLLRTEARVFGIPFPLAAGWLAKYGSVEISPKMRNALEAALKPRANKTNSTAGAGLAVLNGGPLPPKAVKRSVRVKADKKARKAARLFAAQMDKADSSKMTPMDRPHLQPRPAPRPFKPSTQSSVKAFISHSGIDPNTDAFLQSFEWSATRMMAFKQYGTACQCCGASPKTGAVLNVDHIKPRKLLPELALDIKNLQVLCGPCNKGKGNWDQTDWRAAA